MAPTRPPPKAILFDVGGVCVISPMQAIRDYEEAHDIPYNWVNYAVSRSFGRADGAWPRVERGEIPLDAAFFKAFHSDLHDEQVWRDFHTGYNAKRQKQKDGVGSPATGSASASTASSTTSKDSAGASQLPTMPQMDVTTLFWAMMVISRTPDPAMAPALRALRASGRFVLGALSNTVKFPDWHPLSKPTADDIRQSFDIFVSSAHAGVRKPHREAYELAIRELNAFARRNGRGEIKPEDILFLDDIGANLKTPRDMGMRTIKVDLGRTVEAVREMETIVGFDLGSKKAKL